MIIATVPTTPTKPQPGNPSCDSSVPLLADVCAMFGEAYSEAACKDLERLIVQHGGRVVGVFEPDITHYLIPSFGGPTAT